MKHKEYPGDPIPSRDGTIVGTFVLIVVVVLLAIAAVMSVGCNSADLQRAVDAQRVAEEQLAEATEQYQAGTITEEELQAIVAEIKAEYAAELEKIKDEVIGRTAPVPITGNTALDSILNLLGLGAGLFGVYKKAKNDAKTEVNAERDSAHMQRELAKREGG